MKKVTRRADVVCLMSSLATLAPLKEVVVPAFEASTGFRCKLAPDPTAVLLSAIRSGTRADGLIALEAAVVELAEAGVLDASAIRPLVQSAIGIAQLRDRSAVDISSPEALRSVLLSASSIAVSNTGVSGIAFARVLSDLRISHEVANKLVRIEKGLAAELLVNGHAEFAVQQLSELLAVPGIDLIGPFPEPHNARTRFCFAPFRETPKSPAIEELTRFIFAPQAASAYRSFGLEPLFTACTAGA
ncbi:substrate-binding domain-containing protein [Bradyrhizobium barranii subsp. apii]|uniref:Substrate-binding domain-containing protein n=1 Tax=Bradyrhizobium barranii subsp. apii TaxID=2819348 RepID=A0A8T5V6X3_9BRAD|nr:substrate-binding domain-containing protein [Bradyrhizobium barranii]UPT86963.1 substrate-binding domain-containing protein [Bradyrhizobium barranii subsp. apii]